MKLPNLWAVAVLLLVVVSSFGARGSGPVAVMLDGVSVTTKTIATGLDTPIFLTSPPGDSRLFVIEKVGRIRIIQDGVLLEKPFLDISALVASDSERGLLGLAFDPHYDVNGRIFIDYTPVGSGAVAVASLHVSSDPNAADAQSLTALLTIPHPNDNHNGGWIAFGPDELLYVAVGDGGGAGDTDNNAQNTGSLLGKILRIDVHDPLHYSAPPDNPFASGGGAPEVFAYGLRNPWRNSFDGDTLYIGDVGQQLVEEVDVIPLSQKGANFGWRMVEGDTCFKPFNCDVTGTVAPIFTYRHRKLECAITGGYVYRGKAIPSLSGRYFFADYCTGVISSFRYKNGAASDLVNLPLNVGVVDFPTSFGVDAAGELYVMFNKGSVEVFVPAN